MPGAFAEGARWIVAGKKSERISRLVIVFPIPRIRKTVVKEVWDLSDYPSAWPQPKGQQTHAGRRSLVKSLGGYLLGPEGSRTCCVAGTAVKDNGGRRYTGTINATLTLSVPPAR
jgi:hypothetical protein